MPGFQLVKPVSLLMISLVAVSVNAAEDDVVSLRRQLEDLKKENAALRAENVDLRREIRDLKASRKDSDGVDPSSGDSIVGRVWEITATGRGGKQFGPARFLAHNGSIYIDSLDNPKIGKYTEKGPNVRLDVFNAPVPEVNGVYTLIQIGKQPPTYTGNATNTKGTTFRVQLRMLND